MLYISYVIATKQLYKQNKKMNKQVKFKNSFNSIFTGTLVETYYSKKQNITHHKIIDRRLIKKSDMKPFIMNGINVINISDEKTILDSHII